MERLKEIEQPLEPIEYLVRSPSRLGVLDAIEDEPRTRNDLKEMVDVSRVTLSRILSNFEDREWIERTNGEYEVTPKGAFVATELNDLLTNIETLDRLDESTRWLPIDAFDFDLRCLRDANVASSSWGDHTAQIRRVAQLIQGSERIIATASGVSRDVLQSIRDAVVTDGASFEGVYDTTALDIVRARPELYQPHVDIIEAGGDIYRYEGNEEPILLVTVCDDTVILCGHDDDGAPPGTLDSTNENVRSWAESYYERIRSESTQIGPAAFRS